MGLLNAEQQARAWKRFHMEQPYGPTQTHRGAGGLYHMIAGLTYVEQSIDSLKMSPEEKRQTFGSGLILAKWARRGVIITRTEAEQILNTKR